MICVAPNGARRGKVDHPALPMTPGELATVAAKCCEAGASALHLHVRDEAGRHTLEAAHYRAALKAVRSAVGRQLILQVTTEAVGIYTPQQQMDCVRALVPEAASIAIRELVPTADDEALAGSFFLWAAKCDIALQYIVYSPDEAARLVQLTRRGVIADSRPHALFVLGRYSQGQRSSPADLLPFLQIWPDEWHWSLCAFGDTEAQCAAAAVALGGHVRVGFENNLLRADGQLATDNSEQVANIRTLAGCCGRPLANISQARDIYGVPTAPS